MKRISLMQIMNLKNIWYSLDQQKINNNMANKVIEWKFNPLGASNLEEFYEAIIESSKRAINAVFGKFRHNRRETLHSHHRDRRSSKFMTTDVSKEVILRMNLFLLQTISFMDNVVGS